MEEISFIPETIHWPMCPDCGCLLLGPSHLCTPWVMLPIRRVVKHEPQIDERNVIDQEKP